MREIQSSGLALVVVDMQDHFLRHHWSANRARIIEGQRDLIRQCAAKDVLVIGVEYDEVGPTVDAVRLAIHAAPRKIFLEKNEDDAFRGSELLGVIREHGIHSLVFAGVNASACVAHTADSARLLERRVFVAHNLVSDRIAWSGSQAEIDEDTVHWYRSMGAYAERIKIRK